MRKYTKKSFPVEKVRRFLEPGPGILISSAWKGERNIMTCGWHMMMEYTQVGCFIWDQNHSHQMIRRSKQCVINIPTADLINTVIDIGNCHAPELGGETDKFEKFGLTPAPAARVKAPLIAECFANFECKLIDTSLINKYSLFVFEVVKAHVATLPKYPTTVHYRGDGVFMVSGNNVDHRRRFKQVNL